MQYYSPGQENENIEIKIQKETPGGIGLIYTPAHKTFLLSGIAGLWIERNR
jgi:hypothetical protein